MFQDVFLETTLNQSEIDQSEILAATCRKRRSRIALDITKKITEFDLPEDELIEVLALSLKKLNVLDKFSFTRKPSKSGRKLTPFIARKTVWDFWHENSQETTNTHQVAKMRINQKPQIQNGLDFISSVTMVKMRNRDFFQALWKTVTNTYVSLYLKYCKEHPEFPISWGTFLALKPFYVRHTSQKDLEMCCCKLHLHARWSIEALIKCANKQVAIAADRNSLETFWFVKIFDNNCIANGNEVDDYGNIIADGSKYIKGQFLEFLHENKNKKNYKLSNKVTYFYKESILYPFVNMNENKNSFELSYSDFADIIYFVESNGFCHI